MHQHVRRTCTVDISHVISGVSGLKFTNSFVQCRRDCSR